MISKIYNEFVKYIITYFKEYDYDIQTQYNSDIGIIKQYVSSINYRYMYKDVDLFDEKTIKKLHKESYILMLYKYNPIKKNPDMFNNINFELVFDPKETMKTKMEWNKIKDPNVIQYLRGIKENYNTTPDDYPVRDMIFADFEMDFEIITSSTNIINDLQFLYLFKFANKSMGFDIEFIIDDDIEPITFNYNITFEEISEIGHIDFQQYGNIQHLTFNAKITGPVLSNFESRTKPIKKVNLVMDFLPKNNYDDKLLHNYNVEEN